MNQARKLPVAQEVPARLSECETLLIVDRCPFCGRPHTHGAGGGYGHVWAHCHGVTPGQERGYVLAEAEVGPRPECRGKAAVLTLAGRRRRQ